MDFLFVNPYELSINDVHVHSQKYWSTPDSETVGFVYNHPQCEISRTQKEDIEIGNHLLQFLDFQMTFNGTTISSKSSPIESTRTGTQYLYICPDFGVHLRNYLRNSKFFMNI
uniref:Uncharacterized protein n=1 Tax=Megaselia scalaris TaxID=36166 RepID=T1GKV5_MEGSC